MVMAYNDPEKRYRGKYCQCNDYICNYYKKMLCGGPWLVLILSAHFHCCGVVVVEMNII